MGEPSSLFPFFSTIGASGFSAIKGMDQYQHTNFDLGHIPRESASHCCSNAIVGDVQGTIGVFEMV